MFSEPPLSIVSADVQDLQAYLVLQHYQKKNVDGLTPPVLFCALSVLRASRDVSLRSNKKLSLVPVGCQLRPWVGRDYYYYFIFFPVAASVR